MTDFLDTCREIIAKLKWETGLIPTEIFEWSATRRLVAQAQTALKMAGFDPGPIDGFFGPQTDAASEEWRCSVCGLPEHEEFGKESDAQRIFGAPGNPKCTAGKVIPPWSMYLAWDIGTPIRKISCHEKVADSAQAVFNKIAEIYSLSEIHDLGLHLFGGCYNLRTKRGGSSYSMHAYGIAMDFDPLRNRLNWNSSKARLGQPDAKAFWDAWEMEGWVSLGREKNYDWMHVQGPGL